MVREQLKLQNLTRKQYILKHRLPYLLRLREIEDNPSKTSPIGSPDWVADIEKLILNQGPLQ